MNGSIMVSESSNSRLQLPQPITTHPRDFLSQSWVHRIVSPSATAVELGFGLASAEGHKVFIWLDVNSKWIYYIKTRHEAPTRLPAASGMRDGRLLLRQRISQAIYTRSNMGSTTSIDMPFRDHLLLVSQSTHSPVT